VSLPKQIKKKKKTLEQVTGYTQKSMDLIMRQYCCNENWLTIPSTSFPYHMLAEAVLYLAADDTMPQ